MKNKVIVSKKQKEKNEWNELSDYQDNKIKELEERCQLLEQKNKEDEDQIIGLEIEKEEIEKQFNYEKSGMNQKLQCLKSDNDQLSKKVHVFGNLPELPKDLMSVVNLIEKVQSDKLIFLPESKKSSKESKFQEVCPSWSLLWNMSTLLWNLVFDEKSNCSNIEKEFKDKTNFDLTLCDGKMTNKDRKYTQLRKRKYNGIEIDITPHCKIDKSKGLLRIHFYFDYTKKVIVVGHCGDHLENYMTLKK